MLQHESSHGPRVVSLLPQAISSIKKTASDTLAGTAPMSHYLGLDPMAPRFSSVSCQVILQRPESPSGSSDIKYNILPLHGKCSLLFYKQRLILWETTGTASIPAAQLQFPAQSHAKARLAVKSHDNQ